MIRIAVLVSGGGTNLQALIDADNPYGEIALVVSSKKDVYALERARLAGIPSEVVPKKKYGAGFAAKLIETLRERRIDLIVLAGYLTILPPEVIREYDRRIVNIHPALLPSFGGIGMYGLAVHEAALARGVKVTGATAHYVNEIADGGKIIAQKAVGVREGDTPQVLQKRVMEEAEWVILPETVRKICKQLTEESDR
ncbi:MAG: phosphoribosylglycinamide formyltransferase [Oscillospiraceae bacterium]|jgi:phosphoribosylglycinamide formyltransferase-1|nr:phosphoribosylglycinamide formyltransferase [Oscillospiraceae bacterium]